MPIKRYTITLLIVQFVCSLDKRDLGYICKSVKLEAIMFSYTISFLSPPSDQCIQDTGYWIINIVFIKESS